MSVFHITSLKLIGVEGRGGVFGGVEARWGVFGGVEGQWDVFEGVEVRWGIFGDVRQREITNLFILVYY